ncbi:MAG TPA: NAD(P)H-hydrate dehydratase [Desulfotignum sp.]|nr:NAD(P)H-hydrate dehydratase [Desulfotignum sp.]
MMLVTAEQMQAMDSFTINEFKIPGLVLMENAGRGACDFFMETFTPDRSTRVAVVAGRGNNGGDGWVMARYLMEKHIPVTVFLLSEKDKVSGDAKTNMDFVEKLLPHFPESAVVQIADAAALAKEKSRIVHQDLFIDAIFGTGLNSDVKGFFRDVIQCINQTQKPVFAVDISSGLNADTGKVCGVCIKASATATFAFAKIGHILYPGNQYTGKLRVIDIGIPGFAAQDQDIRFQVLEKYRIAQFFPPRQFNSHKGDFGHLMIVSGSVGKTGAAALCANAAQRCGTGLVTLGVPAGINAGLEPMVTEPMTVPLPETQSGALSAAGLNKILALAKDKQALALGPGMGTDPETRKLVLSLVENCSLPLIMDADAINCIAEKPEILASRPSPAVLTPHPGEMARLAGFSARQVQADRPGTARKFAEKYNTIVVLKGAQTLIALPDGQVFLSPTGNPGMATAGMGDVLTGMISGLAAQGFSLENAALAGVYIHGLCGDMLVEKIGPFGFVASDMTSAIPGAMHRMQTCTR